MAGYPTLQDLESFIDAAGVPSADWERVSSEAENALASAIRVFETETGYLPFYVAPDAPTTTRTVYTDGGRSIELGGGLIGQVSYSPSLTVQTHLRARSLPETPAYAVLCGGYNTPGEIEVTGLWGACTDLPPDVRGTILQIAARTLAPSLAQGLTTAGTLVLEKVGEWQKQYANAQALGYGRVYNDDISATIARYKRPKSPIA